MLLRSGLVRTVLAGCATVLALLLSTPTGSLAQVGHPSGVRGGVLVPAAHTLTPGTLSLGGYGFFARQEDINLNKVLANGTVAYGLSEIVQIYGSGSNFFWGTGDDMWGYAGNEFGYAVGPIGLTFRLPRPRTAPFQMAIHASVTPGINSDALSGHFHEYSRDSFDASLLLSQSLRVGTVDLRAVEGFVLAGDSDLNIPNHGVFGGGLTWWLSRNIGIEAEILSRFETERPLNIMEDYVGGSGGMVIGLTSWLNVRGGWLMGLSEDRIDGIGNRAEEWGAYGSVEILFWNKQEHPDRARPMRVREEEEEVPEPEPVRPVIEPTAADTDGDGVPNDRDLEPETPAGAVVDASGRAVDSDGDGVPDGLDMEPATPAGAVVDAEGRAVDSDADGVPDGIDLEPMTPAGAMVDSMGVAIDTDQDGVPDGIDLEPNTLPGIPVSTEGVGLRGLEADLITKGLLTLNTVYFDIDAATIKPESFGTLTEVGLILNKYRELKIEVGGHTDNTGAAEYNQQLSQARAQSVLNWLLDGIEGLALDQFTVLGYGLRQPVASNDTEDGRTLNRRVEFKVLNPQELDKYRRRPPQ